MTLPIGKSQALLAAALLSFVPHAHAATLETEASTLRDRCLQIFAGIQTLTQDCRISIEKLGPNATPLTTTAAIQPVHQSVTWKRATRKLKRSRLDGAVDVQVADVPAGRLMLQRGAATQSLDSLPPDQLESLAVPQPAWLWHLDALIPAHPSDVKADGPTLVLTSSAAHPRRRVWLDRSSGRLTRFEDTDATGATVETVLCTDWRQAGTVWLPFHIEETITARKNGVKRVFDTQSYTVNPTLTEDAFALP